ncbi:TonB-dependent receptor [Pedobacter sp. Du54]|uniref:SusC/RagA family TonB-linked outer membrane protein n=1 Tax=Pedobacter anseongensis TaxID=3133439 RepID=UPI0030A9F867
MNKKITIRYFPIGKKVTLIIMKAFIFLFCLTIFSFTPNLVVSQNAKVKLEKEQLLSVDEVFDLIMKQTEYKFFYEEGIFKNFPKIKVAKGSITTNNLLNSILTQGNLEITLTQNNAIIIKEKPIVALKNAEDKKITGVVTDSKGILLPGVNIVEKGTKNSVQTNEEGKFSLTVANENAVIVISYIGFATKEVVVSNQTTLKIVLEESTTGLDQVVVIGYGSVKRKDLTGSVASISSESIERVNTPSINGALQGLAAGVQVTASEGRPGEASTILIRGGSSISASNEPLYVIDGFPQLGGDNLDLNPQDIASIDILKDASAGAIYGARASNGVVIITTKSGSKNGKINISYTARQTMSTIIKKLETINIVDYAKIQQVLAPLDKRDQFANPNQWIDSTAVDWQDNIYRTAKMPMHDLQITGGSKNTKYAASLSYVKQDGIAIGSDYSRLNSRLRLETDINDKLTAGVNISYATDGRNGPSLSGEESAGVFILRARPYIPGGPADDLVNYVDPDVGTGQTTTNPLRWITGNDALKKTLTFRTINYLDFKPFKGFTLRASGSLSKSSAENQSYLPSDVGIGRNYNGIANISHGESNSWLFEQTANYKIGFADHNIETLLGFSAQSRMDEGFSVKSQNFPIENLGYNNIGLGVDIFNPSSSREKSSIASLFGRVNYTYKDRYILSASLRRDGSSNLGKDNKWGTFPSFAFAWKASNESFIKGLNIFSELKLRTSYGVTGNNSIGNYRSLGTYSTANVSNNGALVLGLMPGSMANKNLKWEQNEQLDLGIDMGFFKGRLNITADYYRKKSQDLLLNAPIPINSGYSTYVSNIGDIQSTGYEFDLRGVIFNSKNFSWTSAFNISFPSTKVLKLSETDQFFTGSWSHKTSIFIVKVGEALGSMYGYVYDGVNQNQDEVNNLPQFGGSGSVGGPRYRDINGPNGVPDGVIDSKYDRTILGNGLPDVFGGFTNKIVYKNFDLAAVFTYSLGNEILNANKSFLWRPGYLAGGLKEIMNAWTPENPTNDNWAWDKQGIEYNNISSWLVEDGSFVRLKNLTMGYALPSKLIKSLGIERCRMFISGENLLTFSNYSGYDPESSISHSMLTPGVDLTNYPNQKSFTIGINLTF